MGHHVCLAAFLAVGCSGLNQGEAQAPDRPNAVFILADDGHADDYEYMPQTRQLLTEGGTTFEEAFVTHSLWLHPPEVLHRSSHEKRSEPQGIPT